MCRDIKRNPSRIQTSFYRYVVTKSQPPIQMSWRRMEACFVVCVNLGLSIWHASYVQHGMYPCGRLGNYSNTCWWQFWEDRVTTQWYIISFVVSVFSSKAAKLAVRDTYTSKLLQSGVQYRNRCRSWCKLVNGMWIFPKDLSRDPKLAIPMYSIEEWRNGVY